MQGELKISVVLPVYNCEKYVTRSIYSVLKQTYSNWELIIVNDGSKDSSEKLILELVKMDTRIKFINQENRGVSVARNKGMEVATGDILMFLDADDWFEDSAFETVIDNWDASIQMLLFDYYDAFKNGKKKYRKHFEKDKIEFGKRKDFSIDDLELVFSGFYRRKKGTDKKLGAPWGIAFKADYIKQRGLKFPENLFSCEDQVFNLSAIIEMKKAIYFSKAIYNYYTNTESVTFVMYEKNGERFLSNIIKRNNYVKDIFLTQNNRLYETAYYKYVFEGIKMILWCISTEKDDNKKNLGRDYCHLQSITIRKHLCKEYSFSDRIILALCEKNYFGIIEKIVGNRKRVKKTLNIR